MSKQPNLYALVKEARQAIAETQHKTAVIRDVLKELPQEEGYVLQEAAKYTAMLRQTHESLVRSRRGRLISTHEDPRLDKIFEGYLGLLDMIGHFDMPDKESLDYEAALAAARGGFVRVKGNDVYIYPYPINRVKRVLINTGLAAIVGAGIYALGRVGEKIMQPEEQPYLLFKIGLAAFGLVWLARMGIVFKPYKNPYTCLADAIDERKDYVNHFVNLYIKGDRLPIQITQSPNSKPEG